MDSYNFTGAGIMNRKLQIFAVVFLLMVIAQRGAYPLALSEIKLNSSLNQPLDAIIELISADADELNSLNTIVSRRDGTIGIQQWPHLQVELVRVDQGHSYLKITSEEAVREPILDFLLELDWANGRIKREYSLLIDPQ